MKILHIVRNIEYRGGAEEFVMRLIDKQSKEYSVGLCCIEGTGKISHSFENEGVDVYDLPTNWAVPLSINKILNLVRERSYDIVHTHLFSADVIGSIVAKFIDIPVISTKYCMFSRGIEKNTLLEKKLVKPLIDGPLEKMVSSNIAEIHAVSSEVKKKWSNITNVPIKIIPCSPRDSSYGINTFYDPKPDILRLGTLSRLVPEKGIDLGLKIVNDIRKTTNLFWRIAGEGYLYEKLCSQISELGLEENVELIGKIDDTQSFLKAIDIYFHPSISEGLPIAIQEAMFSRKPIVASDVGGIPDLVIPGFNGVLINPYNITESSRLIKEYINNHDRIITEGRNSRKIAEEKYAFEEVYGDIIQSYTRRLRC